MKWASFEEKSKALREIVGDNPDGYIHYMMDMQKEADLWQSKAVEYRPSAWLRIKWALSKLLQIRRDENIDN